MPEGWKTRRALARELGIDQHTIQRIIERKKYEENNPEFFGYFRKNFKKDHQTGTYKHYSPQFIEILKNEIKNEYKDAFDKKYWRSIEDISRELGISKYIVEKIENEYKETNPEYFKKFKTSKYGNKMRHYSPEFIDILKKENTKTEKAPKGWFTSLAAAKKLGIHRTSFNKLVDTYKDTEQENMKIFKDSMGRANFHYAPELIEKLKDIIVTLKKPSDEWKHKSELAEEFHVDKNTIYNIANAYRDVYPEYFNMYKNQKGRPSEFFSPQLVEIIKNKIKDKHPNISEAPENWKTREDISQKTGLSQDKIKYLINKHRKNNSEDIGTFKDRE